MALAPSAICRVANGVGAFTASASTRRSNGGPWGGIVPAPDAMAGLRMRILPNYFSPTFDGSTRLGEQQRSGWPVPWKWYCVGMRSTIDKAGRLVVPKVLRDRLGLRPGAVEISADGAALRVEPVTEKGLERKSGRLLIPATGMKLDDGVVRALRDADQR